MVLMPFSINKVSVSERVLFSNFFIFILTHLIPSFSDARKMKEFELQKQKYAAEQEELAAKAQQEKAEVSIFVFVCVCVSVS